jgi:hypothetical protein
MENLENINASSSTPTQINNEDSTSTATFN